MYTSFFSAEYPVIDIGENIMPPLDICEPFCTDMVAPQGFVYGGKIP
jgi:hypothetical protein